MTLTFVMNDLTVGGAQRLFIHIANRFADRGHDVTLVSLSTVPNRITLVDEVSSKVHLHRLAFTSAYDWAGWRALVRILCRKEKGIVISTLFLANMAVRVLRLLHRQPVIVVEQNTYDQKPRRMILVDRILATVTKKIICTSQSVLDFTAAQEHIPLRKFMVIHSGVDPQALRSQSSPKDRTNIRKELGIPEGARLFLDVARLTAQKGHELLIDSAAALCAAPEYKDVYFLLVGEGGLEANLRSRTERLGLSDRIIFAGARHDIARFYAASDYFLSTSRIEGFSLVHAEAMAFGLPIVTTRTAGPDVMVLEGETGYFVEGSVVSVVEGCVQVLAADYQQLRMATLERVEEFSIDATVTAYEKLCMNLS